MRRGVDCMEENGDGAETDDGDVYLNIERDSSH